MTTRLIEESPQTQGGVLTAAGARAKSGWRSFTAVYALALLTLIGAFNYIDKAILGLVITSAFLDTETRAPGFQTVDARVGRELWPRSQLYIGALNLLDVTQEPGRIGDTRSPLGRIFYLGLRGELPWEDE